MVQSDHIRLKQMGLPWWRLMRSVYSLRPRVIKTPRLNEGNALMSEADKRNMK
jgi:hypothetical protein